MLDCMALAAVIEHLVAPAVDVDRLGAPWQLAFLHAARGATLDGAPAGKQGGGHKSSKEFYFAAQELHIAVGPHSGSREREVVRRGDPLVATNHIVPECFSTTFVKG